jgi:hypothetical protein
MLPEFSITSLTFEYFAFDFVKKKQLDSHSMRCQASVTCLDCSTTFNGPASWKSHTSCISEAQKYQKSFVSSLSCYSMEFDDVGWFLRVGNTHSLGKKTKVSIKPPKVKSPMTKISNTRSLLPCPSPPSIPYQPNILVSQFRLQFIPYEVFFFYWWLNFASWICNPRSAIAAEPAIIVSEKPTIVVEQTAPKDPKEKRSKKDKKRKLQGQ